MSHVTTQVKNQDEKVGELYVYKLNQGEVYRVRFVSEEDEKTTYHVGSVMQFDASIVNNVTIPAMKLSAVKIEVTSVAPIKNIIVNGHVYRGDCVFLSSVFKFPQNRFGTIHDLPDIFSYKFKGVALIGLQGAVYADNETLIIDTSNIFN
jgi:hypothetical protein